MNQHTISRISISLLAIVLIIFGFYHFIYPQNPYWVPAVFSAKRQYLDLYPRCCVYSCRHCVYYKQAGKAGRLLTGNSAADFCTNHSPA